MSIAPNPSHLEAVAPVVLGLVRAEQARKAAQNKRKAMEFQQQQFRHQPGAESFLQLCYEHQPNSLASKPALSHACRCCASSCERTPGPYLRPVLRFRLT